MKRLILLILFTSIAAYSATEWGNLIVKGNLSVNGTGTVGGTSILTQTNTVSGITNKTLTSPAINGANLNFGTATNTNRLLLPTETSTNLDALTDTAGLIAFDTTENKPVYNNGSGWTAIGSGSGGSGGINFVTNGEYETNITGTNTYADAAAATPVDGTGGSSSLTLSRTTTAGEVQRGTGSLKIAKGAVNEQGEGVSYDFTVDGIDYAASKAIIVTFDYETTANYASNDMRVFVYDRDGATLLNVLNGESGNMRACTTGCKFVGVFYTTSGNNDYRLIFHVATTNASAYDVYIDNIRAGPDQVVPGGIVQDLGSETWADSEANSTTTVYLSRNGNKVRAFGRTTFTGTFSGTGFSVTIPSTYTPDTTVYANRSNSTATRYSLGTTYFNDVSAGVTFIGVTALREGTDLRLLFWDDAAAGLVDSNPTASTPFTWASGDYILWHAEWIVSGWQASAAISTTEAMLSTVKARYTRITAQSLNSATIMDFSTKDYDTHNAVTTGSSWKFTAPKTGYYKVRAGLQWVSRAYTAGNNVGIQLYKNGSFYSQGGGLVSAPTTASHILSNQHSDTVYLRQGDYIDYRATNGAGATNSDVMEIAIEEDPDFSVFGVYGNFELLTATSATKTPAASAQYQQLSGNSLTLTPGTWKLWGGANFTTSGGAATYTDGGLEFFAANGADSSSSPADISTVPGLTVLSTRPNGAGVLGSYDIMRSGGGTKTSHPIIVRCANSCTVHLVTYSVMSTPANARITVYANAERLQ